MKHKMRYSEYKNFKILLPNFMKENILIFKIISLSGTFNFKKVF